MAEGKSMNGWLVVSDVDGTLNNKIRQTPKKNIEAIDRFVRSGGIFTLASGRNVQSIKKHYDKLPLEGMPAIVMNGSGIYDFGTGDFLYKDPICPDGMELVRAAHRRFQTNEVAIFTSDNIYCLNAGICCRTFVGADHLDHHFCASFDEIPSGDWCKVIVFGLPLNLKKVMSFMQQHGEGIVKTFHSSIIGFEIVNGSANKGAAVLRLAKMKGIAFDHTAAIGDYYNDVDMLKAVGVSAACGQAPKDIKAIVDYQACHCNHGAVADFLNYIENKSQ